MTEILRQAENSRITYVYLRCLLILLPALLLVVTVFTVIHQGELESSISDYYGGPVRDIFVGCLFAIAACLVAYQGVGLLEDYTLNGAGFYAIFVALVPNSFVNIMDELRVETSPGGITPADYVSFLRIALTSVLALCIILFAREIYVGNLKRLFVSDTGSKKIDWLNRGFVMVTMALLIAFLALAMIQLWFLPAGEVTMQGLFGLSIHDLAAFFLIFSLLVAVLTNTWPYYRLSELWRTGRFSYLVIAAFMTIGIVVPLAVARIFLQGREVILLEWWEIGCFAVFWSMETLRQYRLDRGTLKNDFPSGLLREPERAVVT